jgi:hypothetical protein
MSEEDQNQQQKKALLTLAIELGDKKKQLLNIYLDSKPEQLAYDFCLQNNLDFDSMQNLTEEIKNALSNYKNEPNQDIKNQISEKEEPTLSNKNNQKSNEFDMEHIENQDNPEESRELSHDEYQEKIENENLEHNIENKENENEHKTEELSDENNEKRQNLENQNEYQENQEKEEIHSDEHIDEHEHDNNQEHESENEHAGQEHEEENEQLIKHEINLEEGNNTNIKKNIEKNENIENQEENQLNIKQNEKIENKDIDQLNKKNENNENDENENNENNEKNIKKEENEEELAKEEEGDEMMDMNENEDDEVVPSYLSPTICFQYKQRQIAQPKPKSEYSDFDTTYQKKDKTKEFVSELNEEVVNHLNINQNNQKYLPKDYYDNPEGKNFGERLYQRELKLKEKAMEKIKNKVKEENKAKEENLTFVPKINEYNIIALQNRKINRIQYNDENRIIHYKDYLMAKENKVKNKILKEEDATFMPKLNKNSMKMTEGRTTKIPRYEQLYKTKLDVKKLEEKIYDEQNMFKPKINKNYKGGKSDNKKMEKYASLTFEERQKKFKELVEEKRSKLIEQKNTNIDKKTGKKLFNPSINKNKKLDNERKNKPIFNELYSDSEKYKIKKEELEKKVLELEQFNTQFKASLRSEEMYDKQKNIAFEKVFKRLDSDKDGKISKNNIDLYGISKRLMKIISPIMDELKNGNKAISCEEFVKKCEKIYETLNYADKKELFIYTMGGAIKSVYETEPFRRKQVQRKSKGKSLKNTVRTNNLKYGKYIKDLKPSHI